MATTRRRILRGLSVLHKAGFGHGDLRWDNIIWISDENFIIIDLEGTIALDSEREQQLLLGCGFRPYAWGPNKEALVECKFTTASDLYMLGCMIEEIKQKHPAAESDDGLAQALMNKELSLEQAEAHAWLQK